MPCLSVVIRVGSELGIFDDDHASISRQTAEVQCPHISPLFVKHIDSLPELLGAHSAQISRQGVLVG